LVATGNSVGSTRRALPSALVRPLAVVAGLAAVAAAWLGLLVAGESTGTPLDERLLGSWAGSVAPGTFGYAVGWTVGGVGDPVPALALVSVLAIVCLALHRVRLAVVAVASSAIVGVAAILLKHVVGRTIHGDHLAFPSGHTAQVTAMAIVVGLLLVDVRQLGARAGTVLVVGLASVAAAAMAWSQTANAVHYATDTFAGFCLSLAVVIATAWVVDRVAPRLGR
jgi:membrane-associated phospholipid phosphatase